MNSLGFVLGRRWLVFTPTPLFALGWRYVRNLPFPDLKFRQAYIR